MDISTQLQSRKGEKGFTLVELAVVMIIIGLLIGGVLKGQELITNARLTTTASQMESFGAAFNGFIDQYNATPGDMSNATTRLADCGNFAACDDGNGVGIIEIDVGEGNGNDEGTFFFGQLLAAGFITGMDGTDDGTNVAFGITNPSAPVGGGFLVGDARNGQDADFTQALRPRVHVVLNGAVADVAAGNGVVSADQASSIDSRLDDGNPQTGIVVGQDVNNSCVTAAGTAAYDGLANTCALAYRM